MRTRRSVWLFVVVVVAISTIAIAGSSTGVSNTFTINNQGGGTGFRVKYIVPRYNGTFVQGVNVTNEFTANIDWAGKNPSRVVFVLGSRTVTIPTLSSTASASFNMGSDLTYSRSGSPNTMSVTAISADGSQSPTRQQCIWGLQLPQWAISPETQTGPINWHVDPSTLKITFAGSVQVLKGGIQGTVDIPNGVPEFGGAWGVQVNPLMFNWSLSAQQAFGGGNGLTGNFELGGSWGASAKCGTKRKGDINASITGAGQFYPEFRLTDVNAKLGGSFTFLTPRVPLLCQWTGCCHTGYCPYFQASIKPEVNGTISMTEGQPALIAGLKFKDAQLNLAATVAGTVGAGSEGSIYYIAGTIGGKPYIILQFPGNPSNSCVNEYIREIGFELQARFVVECAWWKKEASYNFNLYRCPQTNQLLAIGTPTSEILDTRPVGREYLQASEKYCAFGPPAGTALQSVGGLPGPILNVGTGPMPSISATGEKGLLAFVYDDVSKPTGKHQEIYYARWNGWQWTTHSQLTDNLNPDTQPVTAIDSAGHEIIAWVTGPEPTGNETGPRDVLPGYDVAFSSYEPSKDAWTTPDKLTNNTFADVLPWFERLPSGNLRVCWICSQTNSIPVWNDEEILPSLDVMAADWNGSRFGEPYLVAGSLQSVSPPSVGRDGQNEYLVYLLDEDGNSGTADDRDVAIRSREINGAWGSDWLITPEASSYTATHVSFDSDNSPIVTWVKRMVVQNAPDGTQSYADQLWFSRFSDGSWETPALAFETHGMKDAELVRNEAGKLLLFWMAGSEQFSDVFYSAYDPEAGSWGPPQQMTHDQGEEAMLSFAESGGNILTAYVKRRIDLSDASGLPKIGLSDIYLDQHVPSRDLFVSPDDISVNSSAEKGQHLTVSCQVHLAGDYPVHDVSVRFFDGNPSEGLLIGSDTIPTMLPGGTTPVSVAWKPADEQESHRVYVVVDQDNDILETDDISNNIASALFQGPDLLVSSLSLYGCPSANTLLIELIIRNDGNAIAKPSICEVRREDKTIIYSSSIPVLDPGSSATLHFSYDVTEDPLGDLKLTAVADADSRLDEADESNNGLSAFIPVLPDLQAGQVIIAGANSYELTVGNIGAKPSQPTIVRALLDGQIVGESPLGSIEAGESATLKISIPSNLSNDLLTIVVNPDSIGGQEVSMLNNEAHIQLSAVVPTLADLQGNPIETRQSDVPMGRGFALASGFSDLMHYEKAGSMLQSNWLLQPLGYQEVDDVVDSGNDLWLPRI